jgi:hypothetical protein
MAVDDYLTALAGYGDTGSTRETEPLKGPPSSASWDTRLSQEMAARGRAVMEERLLPVLLADLGPG